MGGGVGGGVGGGGVGGGGGGRGGGGGGGRGAGGAVLAGLALALAGVPGWIPVEGLALGCLVLAAVTLVLPPGGDK